MYLQHSPPQQSDRPIAIGQVDIHPSAAIAPGAILRATPESRIAIAAGVCIGVGVILHAYRGEIVVGEGATLGAGVLVVGCAQIGANACIGAATTIFQTDVDPARAIAPGSILGDPSRKVEALEQESEPEPRTESEAPTAAPTPEEDGKAAEPTITPAPEEDGKAAPSSQEEREKTDAPAAERKQSISYGRTHVSRLLVTLFPHQHPPPSQEPPSEESNSE